MGNTKPYKLTKGKHTRTEDGERKRYHAGQVFVPSDAELKAFGDRLELAIDTPVEVRAKPKSVEPDGKKETETNSNEPDGKKETETNSNEPDGKNESKKGSIETDSVGKKK